MVFGARPSIACLRNCVPARRKNRRENILIIVYDVCVCGGGGGVCVCTYMHTSMLFRTSEAFARQLAAKRSSALPAREGTGRSGDGVLPEAGKEKERGKLSQTQGTETSAADQGRTGLSSDSDTTNPNSE